MLARMNMPPPPQTHPVKDGPPPPVDVVLALRLIANRDHAWRAVQDESGKKCYIMRLIGNACYRDEIKETVEAFEAEFDDFETYGCRVIEDPFAYEAGEYAILARNPKVIQIIADNHERIKWARENLKSFRVVQRKPFISSADPRERAIANLRFAGETA